MLRQAQEAAMKQEQEWLSSERQRQEDVRKKREAAPEVRVQLSADRGGEVWGESKVLSVVGRIANKKLPCCHRESKG